MLCCSVTRDADGAHSISASYTPLHTSGTNVHCALGGLETGLIIGPEKTVYNRCHESQRLNAQKVHVLSVKQWVNNAS